MVLGKHYLNYKNALLKLNMKTLENRRNIVNIKFAQDAVKYNTMGDLFYKNENNKYYTKNHENYQVFHATT